MGAVSLAEAKKMLMRAEAMRRLAKIRTDEARALAYAAEERGDFTLCGVRDCRLHFHGNSGKFRGRGA